MKSEDAMELLKSEIGTHFDPQVVEAFLKCLTASGEISRLKVLRLDKE